MPATSSWERAVELGGQLHKVTSREERGLGSDTSASSHAYSSLRSDSPKGKLGSVCLFYMCSLNLEACVVFRVFHFSLKRSCGPVRGYDFLKVTDLASDRNRS